MRRLSTRLAALEGREAATRAGLGVLIYPLGLSGEDLDAWIAEKASLLPDQTVVLLPEKNRSGGNEDA